MHDTDSVVAFNFIDKTNAQANGNLVVKSFNDAAASCGMAAYHCVAQSILRKQSCSGKDKAWAVIMLVFCARADFVKSQCALGYLNLDGQLCASEYGSAMDTVSENTL